MGSTDHYILAELDQTQLAMTARVNYTFSPALSLQFYAQPFIASGDFGQFLRVQDARARDFSERVERLDAVQVRYDADAQRYDVDLDRNGVRDFTLGNQDFNIKEIRSNAVLRWEYRPGSTLFLVWSQGRSAGDSYGDFRLSRDLGDLFSTPSTNVLLVKFSYWLGL